MTNIRPLHLVAAVVISGALTASPAQPSDFSSVNALAIDPQTPTTVYAATCDGHGVLKSSNAGLTWTAQGPINLGIVHLIVDPHTPTTLYATVWEWICASPDRATSVPGVYKSVDGGVTWNLTGLAGLHLNALVIDPQTPRVGCGRCSRHSVRPCQRKGRAHGLRA